jgi:ATP-binding cassette subfamily C protein
MASSLWSGSAMGPGLSDLRKAQRESFGLVLTTVLFSIFINLLMLTGPLYMLQVYDRVLGSRSEATLVALSALVVFLFLAMGLLDNVRSRVLGRIGARFQAKLDRRVFEAALARASTTPNDPLATSAQRDLESMQRFWASPVAPALMDMPWTPLFLGAIFVFHPMLGWLAIFGGAILVFLAIMNQAMAKNPVLLANSSAIGAERMADC